MEISGYDPKISICKIEVLPIKLYPLYPKNDLNVHDYKPASLKFALSTDSSIRIMQIKDLHLYSLIMSQKCFFTLICV